MTIAADAVSYLLSAMGIIAIGDGEPAPAIASSQLSLAGLAEGWRYILHHRQLRRLFLNTMTVNGLIMAGHGRPRRTFWTTRVGCLAYLLFLVAVLEVPEIIGHFIS